MFAIVLCRVSAAPWVRIVPLAVTHAIDGLASGLPSVDDWFHEKALRSMHLVSTHICETANGSVVGFFALRTIIVATQGMPNSLKGNTHGGQSTAILLAQMGLDKEHQGGNGRNLLMAAFREAAKANSASRVGLFVVDAATNRLVGFYQKAGMKHIPNTYRLVLKISVVEKLVSGFQD